MALGDSEEHPVSLLGVAVSLISLGVVPLLVVLVLAHRAVDIGVVEGVLAAVWLHGVAGVEGRRILALHTLDLIHEVLVVCQQLLHHGVLSVGNQLLEGQFLL